MDIKRLKILMYVRSMSHMLSCFRQNIRLKIKMITKRQRKCNYENNVLLLACQTLHFLIKHGGLYLEIDLYTRIQLDPDPSYL